MLTDHPPDQVVRSTIHLLVMAIWQKYPTSDRKSAKSIMQCMSVSVCSLGGALKISRRVPQVGISSGYKPSRYPIYEEYGRTWSHVIYEYSFLWVGRHCIMPLDWDLIVHFQVLFSVS